MVHGHVFEINEADYQTTCCTRVARAVASSHESGLSTQNTIASLCLLFMGLHEKKTISMNSSMKRHTACMKNLICGTCLNFSFSLRYECTTQRIVRIGSKPIYHKLSRDTMWHFDGCRLRRACAASF